MNIKICFIFLIFGGVTATVDCASATFQPKMLHNDVIDIVGTTARAKRPYTIVLREPNRVLIEPIYVQGLRRSVQVGRSGGRRYEHRKIAPGSRFRMLLRLRKNILEVRMLDADDDTSFLNFDYNLGERSIGMVRTGQLPGTMRKARWEDYVDLPTSCGHRAIVTPEVPGKDLCPPLEPSNSERIIGGTPAGGGAHPWQVSIWERKREGDTFEPICGGTLIGNCWVMTAVHCIVQGNPNNYYVRVGDYYNRDDKRNTLFSTYEDSQDVGVLKIISHREYWSVPNAKNDILLLRLKSSNSDGTCVTFGPFVQPACLPTQETVFHPGKLCHITGWGANRDGRQYREDYSPCLQGAFVRLISNAACQSGQKGYPPEPDYGRRILDSMVCAASDDGKRTDTCQGDSGGPLVCESASNGNQTSIVWGITSWGRGCGENYGVYTKVSEFISWLEEHMLNAVKYDPRTS